MFLSRVFLYFNALCSTTFLLSGCHALGNVRDLYRDFYPMKASWQPCKIGFIVPFHSRKNWTSGSWRNFLEVVDLDSQCKLVLFWSTCLFHFVAFLSPGGPLDLPRTTGETFLNVFFSPWLWLPPLASQGGRERKTICEMWTLLLAFPNDRLANSLPFGKECGLFSPDPPLTWCKV